jgi:hypothetical protein
MNTTHENNSQNNFYISKKLVKEWLWHELSQAGQAVLISILRNSYAKDVPIPSCKKIGEMSGLTERQARSGFNDLMKTAHLRIIPYSSSMGKIIYRYRPFEQGFDPKDIRLSDSLFVTNCWARLTPDAKSIYIVLRSMATFDISDYANEQDFREQLSNREFDIVQLDFTNSCNVSGFCNINDTTYGFACLQDEGLIEYLDDDLCKIYFAPQKSFSSEID